MESPSTDSPQSIAIDQSIENGSNDFPESSKPAACHGSLRGNESKPIIIANCLILASSSECRVIPSRKQEAAGIRSYQPGGRRECALDAIRKNAIVPVAK